jgi:hypothetical protein
MHMHPKTISTHANQALTRFAPALEHRQRILSAFHIALIVLLSLAIVGCNTGSDTPKEGETTADTTKSNGKGTVKQIPAAEILGSTVKRNLRYQPENESKEYMAVDTLLEYIRQVGLSLRKEIGKLQPETPTAGTVVVGLNHKRENRLWYVFPEGQPSAAFKEAAEKAVAAVPKPKVKKRLVVFGVALTLWGYKETEEEAAQVKLPAEWQAISDRKGSPQPATQLAEMTW